MKLFHLGKNFYRQFVSYEDKLIIGLLFLIIGFGMLWLGINALSTHYVGNFYLPTVWLCMTPVLIVMLFFGLVMVNIAPWAAFFLRGYGIIFLSFIVTTILSTGVQYTPFPTVDSYLANIDTWFHIDTIQLLNWTYAHPLILKTFRFFYDFLSLELFLVPVILLFFQDKTQLNTYVIACLVSYLIATNIYYFFPALAPAGYFHDSHFQAMQLATSIKFNEIHHYMPVTTFLGGMIVFPSCHVIWAILVTYAFRNNSRWIFYPMAMINSMVILSTVFLGWHYAIDVFGGLAAAMVSIALAHCLYLRSFPSFSLWRLIKGGLLHVHYGLQNSLQQRLGLVVKKIEKGEHTHRR